MMGIITETDRPVLHDVNKADQLHAKVRRIISPQTKEAAQWYAIYTRSRFEKKIHAALQKAGFQSFLPLIKEKRVWSDRIKTVLVPLLSSYVFIKTTKQFFPQIYPLPGFVKFVAFEGKPCTIREKEIELMEKIVVHGFQVLPATRCRVGDWVRINRGPLTGWEGSIVDERGKSRVIFQFDGLEQAISIEVNLCDVEKV